MNGKMVIDGDCKKHYEIIKHGGQPDPNALCSLIYRTDHNVEVLELLKIIQNSIQNAINAEFDAMVRDRGGIEKYTADLDAAHRQDWKDSIQRCLEESGLDPLPDSTLDCICIASEIEFQKVSELLE